MVLNPYGAVLDSGGTPNAAGSLFSGQNMVGAMLDSGTSCARYQIEWWSIERAVQSTSQTTIAAGVRTIVIDAPIPTNFANGVQVLVDNGSSQETVTITTWASPNLTATFAKAHTGPYPVAVIPSAGDTPASSGSPARVAAYDWSVLDNYITTCQSDGFAIDFVLQNAPVWHTQALAIDASKNVPVPADAANFMTDLYNHLQATFGAKNQFYSVEVANEGFNTGALTSGNAATMFGQMLALLQAVQPIIAANSPATLVVAPAELNKTAINVAAWTAGFYASGCQNYVSAVNFHYYNGNSGPDSPNVGDDSFKQFFTAWASAGGLPIWVTEVGWTLLKGGNGGVADATLAGYITSVLQEAAFSKVVRRVFYYNLGQLAPGNGINQDFTKLSYNAWKSFIAGNPQWEYATTALIGRNGKSGIIGRNGKSTLRGRQ